MKMFDKFNPSSDKDVELILEGLGYCLFIINTTDDLKEIYEKASLAHSSICALVSRRAKEIRQ